MLGDFDVTEQQGMDFITGGSVIIDYGQKRRFKVDSRPVDALCRP